VFLFALLLPLSAIAQQSNTISFAGGYSIPIGKFASKQFSDPEAGLAGSGFYGQLSYERKLANWWGVRLTGSLNSNETNANPLIEQYSILLPNPDTYSWKSEVTKWELGAVLVGPMAYKSIGKVEFTAHVQGGLVFAKSPDVKLFGTSTTGQNAVEGRITSGSTNAFGLGGGGSLRFRLSNSLRFQITGDWIGARAELKGVPTYVKVGNFPAIEGTETRKRFVGVINTGAGFVVVF
jgi:hypothetical protein